MNERGVSWLRAAFTEAAEIEDSAARVAFLEEACKGNAELRQRLLALLQAHAQAGTFFADADEGPGERFIRDKPGDWIGRYRLLKRIGEGGYGVVYLAEQAEPVRRQVALKVIKLGMDTRKVVARFEAERQALALMDHPNIAKVFDAGATDRGRPFFVMEFVPGLPITQFCEQHGLSVRQRLELFVRICQAVQHAHQKGIIHRDLKPSNILVTQQDGSAMPKIIDFGVAKATEQQLGGQTLLTGADQFIGTPAYMSPEQIELGSHHIDTRSDLYSLGILLYELLAGEPPFDPKQLLNLAGLRKTLLEISPLRPSTAIARRLNPSAVAPGSPANLQPALRERLPFIRGDVDWIVMKCLEKDRERRYQAARDLAADIQRHLRHESIVARPPTGFYRFQKIVRRHRFGFAATALVALVLILATVVSTRLAFRAIRAEREQGKLRGLAEAKAEESRQRLLKLQVSEGNRLVRQGNPLSALPWFVAALESEVSDPEREQNQRLRIAEAIRLSPRLLQTVFHGPFSFAIGFSPDGLQLVTGGKEPAMRVWDVSSGRQLLKLSLGDLPRGAQFSPDGTRLVAIDRRGVAYLWDARNGKPIALAPQPRGSRTNAVAAPMARLIPTAIFSPDSRWLLRAWGSGGAQLFRADDGRLVHTLPHAAVHHAAFNAEGTRLVTAGADQAVRIWEVASGQPAAPPLRPGGLAAGCQFSPDGRRLLTVVDHRTIQVWDWQLGHSIGPGLTHEAALVHAAFARDGRSILMAGTDAKAQLCDAATDQIISHFPHPASLTRVALAPNGKSFATVCEDGAVRLWEMSNQQVLVLPHGTEVEEIAFSADGRRLAAAGTLGVVRIWELIADAPARSWPGRGVVWAEANPDGTRMVIAGADGAQVGSATDPDALGPRLADKSRLKRARFSPRGERVLTLAEDGRAAVWEASKGTQVSPGLTNFTGWADGLFSPDGQRLALAGTNPIARIWNLESGEQVTLSTQANPAISIAFSPDGNRIAVGSRDRTVQICDGRTGMPVLGSLRQPNAPRQMRFSPDGQRLVTACAKTGVETGFAMLWSVATGQRLGAPMGHLDDLLSVEFSHDGRSLITGCDDRSARIWNAFSGEPLAPPLWHASKVIHALFAPDDRYVATLTARGELQLWSATTGEAITRPLSHWYAGEAGRLNFVPGKRQLLIATGADQVWMREFLPSVLPLAGLNLQVQLLSGQRVDPVVGLVPLEPTTLSNVLRSWRAEAVKNP